MRRPFPFLMLVLLGIVIDQFSKYYVFTKLGSRPLIDGILHITLAQNRGVAFSMLKDYPFLIIAVSLLAIGVVFWLYSKHWRYARTPLILGLGLLLVGAIGNLIDRSAFGYVRDFIEFTPRLPLIGHWAIFNIADVCITAGALLYLFSEWFYPACEHQPKEPNPSI